MAEKKKTGITVSNISYSDKDFESLWNELIDLVPTITNKWNPGEANESDPLAVFTKLLALYADKINYNSDKHILEKFPSTLTQEKSAYDVYENLGYAPQWYKSATTDISFQYSGRYVSADEEDTGDQTYTFIIPRFSEITTDDSGITFTLLENVELTSGKKTTKTAYAIEGTLTDFTINGETRIVTSNLDEQNRLKFDRSDVAQNGIFVSNYSDFSDITATDLDLEPGNEASDSWVRVDNLAQWLPGYRVYKLGLDVSTNTLYIEFPQDIGELIGDGIYVKYILTSGEDGNIKENSLTVFKNGLELLAENVDGITITDEQVTVNNKYATTNGANPEDIDSMYENFKKIVGTFDTLVTLRDYENFIYQYRTKTTDKAVVSNIRVSDRTNDLYQSLEYVSMGINGDFQTNTITLEDSSTSMMTAYDLRVFGLQPVNSDITTAKLYNTSFSPITEGQHDNVLEAVDTSKHIQHDFSDKGVPIVIPYHVNGTIYLNATVSAVEAANVEENVYKAIYENYNSHEMEWGRKPDFVDFVKVLEGADSRIAYLDLSPLDWTEADPEEYLENFDYGSHTYDVSSDGGGDYAMAGNFGYDVYVRSVLAGVTPWTNYLDFNYAFNQSDNTYAGYSLASDAENDYNLSDDPVIDFSTGNQINLHTANSEKNGAIRLLNPFVNVENKEDGKILYIGPNESFAIIYPDYRTTLTYTNYLYYVYEGATKVLADTPTQLGDNDTIYLFETRDDAYNFVNGSNTSKYAYIIKPGTIIEANEDLVIAGDQLNTSDVINMGSTITISVIERNSGTVESPDDNAFYAITNVRALSVQGEGNPFYTGAGSSGYSGVGTGEYTLGVNEYFIYCDLTRTEMVILGEGTTLFVPDGKTWKDTDYIEYYNDTSLSEIMSSEDFDDYVDYEDLKSKSNGILGYYVNQLDTLGEEYEIRVVSRTTDGTEEADDDNVISLLEKYDNENPNAVFDVGDAIFEDNGEKRRRVVQCRLNGEEEWNDVSLIAEGDGYKGLLYMSLYVDAVGAEQIFTATENQIEETDTTKLSDYYQTRQRLAVNVDSGTGKDGDNPILDNATYIYYDDDSEWGLQSSYALIATGGNAIVIDPELAGDLTLMMYEAGDDFTDASYFHDISNFETDGNYSISIPGNSDQLAVMPVLMKSGIIYYILIKCGGTYSISSSNVSLIEGIADPRILYNTETYYNKSSHSSASVSSILGGAAYVSLNGTGSNYGDTDYTYIKDFCPVYTPDSSAIIEDPTDPESYFNTSHVLNRYAIAKWDAETSDLRVSAHSISS